MPTERRPSVGPVRPIERTAGVDWFRFRVDGLGAARVALDAALTIQEEDQQRGSYRKPWSFQGYEGERTERIRWGVRHGKLIWETSGEWAPTTWTRMPLCDGVATRVDLQQTLRLSQSLPDYGMRFLPREATTLHQTRRSLRAIGISSDSRGLWCGSVGRRISPSFFRLYDKGVEKRCAPLGTLWRVELEAKYQHAEVLCRDHREILTSPSLCASYVESQWLSAGCSWRAPLTGNGGVDVKIPARPAPSCSALACWLQRTVAPVIPRLLAVYTVREVLAMLGMQDVAEPTRDHERRVAALQGARTQRPDVAALLAFHDAHAMGTHTERPLS